MKKDEFDQLQICERINYVGYHGDYIGLRESANCLIGLYTLNGFFVEVHYDRGIEVRKIESIKEEDIISLYMSDMDLDKLLLPK